MIDREKYEALADNPQAQLNMILLAIHDEMELRRLQEELRNKEARHERQLRDFVERNRQERNEKLLTSIAKSIAGRP